MSPTRQRTPTASASSSSAEPAIDRAPPIELLAALDVAVGEFRSRLADVGAAQWTAPTPCDEWDVHALVAHVVGGHRFAARVLAGASLDDAMAAVMGTAVLGDDPLTDHDAMAAAQRAAFRRAGALAAAVEHPTGTITGGEFLAMRVFDVTVHAWDLARATGGDEGLPPALAIAALAAVAGLTQGPGFGMVAPGAAGADGPALAQRLDRSGRRR